MATITTNWRAQCAELLEAVDEDVLDVMDGSRFQAVVDRTRAALFQSEPQAQPEPEVPTADQTGLERHWAIRSSLGIH